MGPFARTKVLLPLGGLHLVAWGGTRALLTQQTSLEKGLGSQPRRQHPSVQPLLTAFTALVPGRHLAHRLAYPLPACPGAEAPRGRALSPWSLPAPCARHSRRVPEDERPQESSRRRLYVLLGPQPPGWRVGRHQASFCSFLLH